MSSSTALWIIAPLTLGAYLAFGILGIRLEHRAARLRIEEPPPRDRWNSQYYRPEADALLRQNRRWERARVPVWLGLILLANLLYWILT
jgi:hypothetical protein